MRGILFLAILLAGCASQPEQLDTEQGKRSSAAVHAELGAGYYGRGQYAVALAELKEAVKSDPSYAPAYNVLGLVYMTLRDNDAAEQNFEHALSINPKDSDINNNYGWFLCQTQREKKSIEHFLAALANPLYTTPEMAYLNAGICSERIGEDRRAERYYQQALQIQPRLAQANLGLARINFRAGNYGLARSYLSSHMQMAEPSPQSLWLGIRIERRLGGSGVEADYGAQLKSRFPESAEAHDLLNGKFE
ncbi:MAG: type IV pilus biogenesis/stability protein PilW [Burkholderiales bacterium]|nr:type IV pilus biogenesis/stability protein PilW [Burkholderiales bacterium]